MRRAFLSRLYERSSMPLGQHSLRQAEFGGVIASMPETASAQLMTESVPGAPTTGIR